MLIRRKYYVFVNDLAGCVYLGNKEFYNKIKYCKFGVLYKCSFSEAKANLHKAKEKGYILSKHNY